MNAIWMNVNLDEIFLWVTRASLYSVAVIAIIVLTQTLMRRALSAKWICALWIILLLRLAIPAGPESALSIWNLAPQRLTQQASSDPVFSVNTVYYETTNSPPDAGFSSRSALRTVLPGIWLTGTLLLMAGIIIGNLRLWNTVRRIPFVTDHALLELFEECRRSMRVNAMVGLVVTDRVKSPILFGFVGPRVLLPADLVRELPIERLRYILLHELAHLKRHDILTGWILAFLQSLHWFNPLVWWAFGRLRFDRELACDEQVLSRVPEYERRDYGSVLIGMLERFNSMHNLPAIAGILENKDQLKRRLIMIKKFRNTTRREIVAFSALFAVLSIAFLTSPQTLLSQSGEQRGVRVYEEPNETDDMLLSEALAKADAERAIADAERARANAERAKADAELARTAAELARTAAERAKAAAERARVNAENENGASDGFRPPEVLASPKPEYTEEARYARIEGVVILSILVRDDGMVDNIKVVSGLGYGLDEAAVESASKWRFRPATRDGAPIDYLVHIEISFNLWPGHGSAGIPPAH